MKHIEISLDIETCRYTIEERCNDNYCQGLNTDDIDEALLYIENLMEGLKNENR